MKRVYSIFLLPYLVFLLIPILVGTVIYYQTIDVVRNEIINNNMSVIAQTRKVLERELAGIDSIVRQAASDPDVVQFQYVSDPFQGADVYKTRATQRSLVKYGFANNFMLDYFILFKDNRVAMNGNDIYPLTDFYEKYMHYDGLDYDQWYDKVFKQYQKRNYWPAEQVVIRNQSHSVISYVNSLGYSGYSGGSIVVLIDNREIQRLLSNVDISKGGSAFIAGPDGTILSSYSSSESQAEPLSLNLNDSSGYLERTVDSEKMMITYTKSPVTGWTYYVVQPRNLVLGKVNYIKGITVSIVLSSLLLGFIVALLLAYRNSRPLRLLLKKMVEQLDGKIGSGGNAYHIIEQTMSRLIDNNEELQHEIDNRVPFLRAAFFERLLKNQQYMKGDIDVMLRHIGVDLQGKYFNVSILHLHDDDTAYNRQALQELDVKKIMFRELLREIIRDRGYVHDIQENKIAMILVFRTDDEPACRAQLAEMLRGICSEARQKLHIQAELAVGGIHSQMTDLPRSHAEAEQALSYKLLEMVSGIVWYDELPAREQPGTYYYPDDVELRLMNLAKAGDEREMKALLAEIIRVNYAERRLPPPLLKLLVSDMAGSILKVQEQSRLDDPQLRRESEALLGELESADDLNRIADDIVRIWGVICAAFQSRKRSSNEWMKNEIIDYLHSAYHLPELNSEQVADRFHISSVYLSQYFKEQTGVNFSEYLENLRMDKAKKLLLDPGLSIGEVTHRVGYNSLNTFGRAFKRIHGINPTAYRRSAK